MTNTMQSTHTEQNIVRAIVISYPLAKCYPESIVQQTTSEFGGWREPNDGRPETDEGSARSGPIRDRQSARRYIRTAVLKGLPELMAGLLKKTAEGNAPQAKLLLELAGLAEAGPEGEQSSGAEDLFRSLGIVPPSARGEPLE